MKITVPTPSSFPHELPPEMEAFIRDNLKKKMIAVMDEEAATRERELLFGDGSNPPPLGIMHTTGVTRGLPKGD